MDDALIPIVFGLPGFVAGLVVALWLAPGGWRLFWLILGGVVPAFAVLLIAIGVLGLDDWDAIGAMVAACVNYVTWALGVIVGAAVRSSRARGDYPGSDTST